MAIVGIFVRILVYIKDILMLLSLCYCTLSVMLYFWKFGIRNRNVSLKTGGEEKQGALQECTPLHDN